MLYALDAGIARGDDTGQWDNFRGRMPYRVGEENRDHGAVDTETGNSVRTIGRRRSWPEV